MLSLCFVTQQLFGCVDVLLCADRECLEDTCCGNLPTGMCWLVPAWWRPYGRRRKSGSPVTGGCTQRSETHSTVRTQHSKNYSELNDQLGLMMPNKAAYLPPQLKIRNTFFPQHKEAKGVLL